MGGILILTGAGLGAAYLGDHGAVTGGVIAVSVWMVWSLIGYTQGDRMLLAFSRAREIDDSVDPVLANVVEEMRIAANLPVRPKIYIMDEQTPNAFATGRKLENSTIVVTAGLLSRLNRNELQGVVAHEMAHILNRDVMFLTFAGILLGTITLISEFFLRGMWYSGGISRRYRSRRSGSSGGAMALIALVLAILAPLLTRIFYFSLSRRREYLADATAARLSRYPEGLASALEKISLFLNPSFRANSITAPMYIVNPLRKKILAKGGLFGTHPPVQKRIQILRSMVGGVNYNDYQKAFASVTGKGIIPRSGLQDSEAIPIKKPPATPDDPLPSTVGKKGLGDLIRAVNGFVFLVCACGLKIKIPPGFKSKQFPCPGCRRSLTIPQALPDPSGAPPESEEVEEGKSDPPQSYTRRGKGWESVACRCGNRVSLSPALLSAAVNCSGCGREISIRPPGNRAETESAGGPDRGAGSD